MLFDKYGYTLVHETYEGVNAFWIRDDVLDEVGREQFPNAGNLQALRSTGIKLWSIVEETNKEWERASHLLEEGEGI